MKKEKTEQIISLLKEWNLTKQGNLIEKIQKITPWYKITPTDVAYLGSFVAHHIQLKESIVLFRKTVSETRGQPIDGDKFGLTLAKNIPLQQAIQNYNDSLKDLQKTKKIQVLKELLLKKPEETIPVIDFIINFIQSRSDFG